MSLENKEVQNTTKKVAAPKSDLEGFFFHFLLFTVVILFPILLIVLTLMFWS
jgi:hypothetical protein